MTSTPEIVWEVQSCTEKWAAVAILERDGEYGVYSNQGVRPQSAPFTFGFHRRVVFTTEIEVLTRWVFESLRAQIDPDDPCAVVLTADDVEGLWVALSGIKAAAESPGGQIRVGDIVRVTQEYPGRPDSGMEGIWKVLQVDVDDDKFPFLVGTEPICCDAQGDWVHSVERI